MAFFLSRKGFEIAIGTVVVLVLGAVIIAGGVLLVKQLFNILKNPVDQIDAATLQQLRKLATDGQQVAVLPTYQEIVAGKTASVGGMIQNKLATTKSFDITVTGKDSGDTPVPAGWIAALPTLTVDPEAVQEFGILVTPDASATPGEYVFVVKVTYQGPESNQTVYDSPRVFSLKVT